MLAPYGVAYFGVTLVLGVPRRRAQYDACCGGGDASCVCEPRQSRNQDSSRLFSIA